MSSPSIADSLLRLVDTAEEILEDLRRRAHNEAPAIQWLLYSFADIYRNVVHIDDCGNGSQLSNTADLSFAQNCIVSCEDLLKNFEASLSSPAQSDNAVILQQLVHEANLLNLTLHSKDISRTGQPVIDVGRLQEQLEESCKWLYKQEGLRRCLRGSLNQTRIHTFALKEAKGATIVSRPPSMFEIICPQASFTPVNIVEAWPLELSFICHCRHEDHRQSMIYEAIDVRGIPTEVTDLATRSSWEMCLYKRGSSVTVLLSDLLPTHLDQLEALSNQWAVPLSQRQAYEYKLKIDHTKGDDPNDVVLDISDNLSVLRTKGPRVLGELKLVGVTLFRSRVAGHGGFFEIPGPQNYLQLFQYAAIPSKMVRSKTGFSSAAMFLDEPHFFIYFSELPPGFRRGRRGGNGAIEFYKIKVCRNTIVRDPSKSGRRFVAVVDVDCIYGSQEQSSLQCSDVRFEFSNDIDAVKFFDSIKLMQNRLLEKSLRRPFWGESIVYRSFDSIPPLPSDTSSFIRTAIVYDPSVSQGRYRVIGTCNDNANTICYDLESLSRLDAQGQPSSDVPPSQFVWTVLLEGSEQAVIRKQNWDLLLKQSRKSKNVHDSESGPALARHSGISSEKWFDEIEVVNLALRGPMSKANDGDTYRPVKVAVIDTGFICRPNAAVRRQIAGYKDFVAAEKAPDGKGIKDKAGLENTDNALDTMKDMTGHGTNSVRLILKVYTDAQLYIARIFEHDWVEGSAERYLMADAITWAIIHKVDIISISAGFQYGLEELHDAVSMAAAAGILIFASAANWSYTDRAAVPARFPRVFGIFATDAGCKNSRAYNPPALQNAHSFAVLGENVRLSPDQDPISGTSVSTALAAGLAARILDFTRQPDCRVEIHGFVRPRTELGMTSILQALANKDGEYECIRPLRILGARRAHDNPDDEAYDRRRAIDFLKRVLEDAM